MPERNIYDDITFFLCILTVGSGTVARIQEFSSGGGGPGQSDKKL